MNVVLLTGFGEGSRKVLNDNKCFIEIDGKPLFAHVLNTLLSLESLQKVVVVGVVSRVRRVVDRHFQEHPGAGKVFFAEQGQTIFESIANGVSFLSPPFSVCAGAPLEIDPILFLPGDIPLLKKREIEVFLEKSAENWSDYCIGIVSEDNMRRFYRQRGISGFNVQCYPFREGTYRINNLHLLKSFPFGKGRLIDRVYQLRFLSDFGTLPPVVYEIFRRRGFKLFFYFIVMQIVLFLKKKRFRQLTNILKLLLSVGGVEKSAGEMLGIKISAVEILDATAAMDIDTEVDYHNIRQAEELNAER